MRHVPYDIVFGHVEYVVEGYGELDDSEGGGEVSAGFAYGFDDFPSEFVGELFELFEVEALHVVGVVDGVENGFGGGAGVGRAGCVVEGGGSLGAGGDWCECRCWG